MSKRRKYSAEFKRGAVEQASQSGVSCTQLSRELGTGSSLLTRWVREAEADGSRRTLLQSLRCCRPGQ